MRNDIRKQEMKWIYLMSWKNIKAGKGKLSATKKKRMKWDEQEQEEMNPLPASERECNEINKNI